MARAVARRVRALCLDLDGTLLDPVPFRESIVKTCRELAAARPGLDAVRLLEANGRVWEGYWPEVEESWNRGALDGAAVSLEAWRRTLRACACDEDSVAQLAVQTHSRHRCEAHRLFDDARELLASLPARLPLALITNGASDTQREKLRTLGVEDRFDAVVISGEVGVAKPDPSAFRLALDGLGVGPEGVWHVGDSLASDVAGASAASLIAVWINRSGLVRSEGDPEPDLEIRSLSGLMPLLAHQTPGTSR